jgi:hypothetical protein
MIHLYSEKNTGSFCGKLSKGDLVTSESPPDRDVPKLCIECKALYYKNLYDERIERIRVRNKRPIGQKFYDWLEQLSMVGESDMEVFVYPFYIVCTAGLIIPAKFLVYQKYGH